MLYRKKDNTIREITLLSFFICILRDWLGSIFHYTVSPFEEYAGEIFHRVCVKLQLNCQVRNPNGIEENAA